MKISDLLWKKSILLDFKGTVKNEVLGSVAEYLASRYAVSTPETIKKKILEREEQMSTGIGYGIAIPHARINGIDTVYLVAVRTAEPIEFNAIDEQPVRLIFMMVSPINTSADHTQILSALSRIMSYEDIRTALLESDDPESFIGVLVGGEEKYVE